jgi:predicted branched-subunit amino acid permease|tara:strand:+ start:293 stop:994 length:702 start_codon:yes stop_codon:yes gene_type:complete
MRKSGYFLKGLYSVRSVDSPAIALGCSFLAIGALLKNIGFNFQQSFFSTFFTYALPGQLVMAESFLVGASLINIFIGVWLVNARLFPMAVSMFPLLKSKKQPKWKYYISCHFLAVSSWLIMKKDYRKINLDNRIDFWMGIGTATWSIAIFSTILGYLVSDYLSKDMMIGLAIVNPIYFFCMLLGTMKNIAIGTSVILGTILGPLFYLVSPEWCILYGGVTAGIVAFFAGEIND